MAKKGSSAHRAAKYKAHPVKALENKKRRIETQKRFEEKKRIKKLKRQELALKTTQSNAPK